MSFGAILVGLGLLCLSVIVVARLWRQQSGQTPIPEASSAAPVRQTAQAAFEAQRDAAYAALADLDFDHSLGKLNEGDYRAVRARLLAQAVAALHGLDAAAADIESQVEALIRSRRAASQSNDRAQNEQRSLTLRPSGRNAPAALYCVGCGATLRPNDRFCGKCATPVAARCPQCGAAVQAGDGDRFCTSCGASLAAGAATA